mmetsp:Transcript_6471/g.16102  ORF Transcript_6471/g.16102 Transcript_6471/m.16102 type:complete len:101 (-) Transcript_6471:161-463(-)
MAMSAHLFQHKEQEDVQQQGDVRRNDVSASSACYLEFSVTFYNMHGMFGSHHEMLSWRSSCLSDHLLGEVNREGRDDRGTRQKPIATRHVLRRLTFVGGF